MEVKGYRGNWWIDFWIPVLLFLIIGSIFITWRKECRCTTLSFDTIFVFFFTKCFDHHHYEPMSDLMYNLFRTSSFNDCYHLLFAFSKQKEIESMP